MANTKSARKYTRKSKRRTLRNRRTKSRLKTLYKKLLAAFTSEDKDAMDSNAREYISALDKAGKSGLVHSNKIARHKSRCALMINSQNR